MLQELAFRLTGISPLLLHNGQMANPTNQFVQDLKEYTKKQKKTDADYEAMRKIEWHGGLYVDKDERPIVPGECIEATLQGAARKQKKGKEFTAGVFCMKDSVIEHDGPKTLKALYKDAGFVDQRMVTVMRAHVLRTRPIFYSWRLNVVVTFADDVTDKKQVIQAMETAGSIIGLCDYRPKFGRFESECLGAVG